MRVREMGRHRCVGNGNIYWTNAAKQSIITRSWINVQTATKAFANGRGLAGIFTQRDEKGRQGILPKTEIPFLKVDRALEKCILAINHIVTGTIFSSYQQFNPKPPRSV